MHQLPQILLALAVLYIGANICGFVLGIKSNLFFAPFHFTGGVLTALLIYSLTSNKTVSFLGTVAVGFLWEIYEWLLWKYFLKKKKFKPQNLDTIFDLFTDSAGALVILGFL